MYVAKSKKNVKLMKDPLENDKYISCHQIWWISDEKWPIETFYNPLKLKLSSVHWSDIFQCSPIISTGQSQCQLLGKL